VTIKWKVNFRRHLLRQHLEVQQTEHLHRRRLLRLHRHRPRLPRKVAEEEEEAGQEAEDARNVAVNSGIPAREMKRA